MSQEPQPITTNEQLQELLEPLLTIGGLEVNFQDYDLCAHLTKSSNDNAIVVNIYASLSAFFEDIEDIDDERDALEGILLKLDAATLTQQQLTLHGTFIKPEQLYDRADREEDLKRLTSDLCRNRITQELGSRPWWRGGSTYISKYELRGFSLTRTTTPYTLVTNIPYVLQIMGLPDAD